MSDLKWQQNILKVTLTQNPLNATVKDSCLYCPFPMLHYFPLFMETTVTVKADSSEVLINCLSSLEENEHLRVLFLGSEWIMNWLTYTRTAFNVKKKKIKKARGLGNKSAIPWGQGDRDENCLAPLSSHSVTTRTQRLKRTKAIQGNEIVCSEF